MERSWILVGMMGAGKSAVGRALAEITGREFVDTDQLLQNRFGRPVGQIFQQYGEDTFRSHETSILKSLEPGSKVVSTGGGIVLRDANWDEMRRLGAIVYLRASIETLTSRLALSKKKRPLLAVEDWEGRLADILGVRAPLYEKADRVFDVDESTIHELAARISAVLKEAENQRPA